jgi:hypothetical protein
MEAIMENIDYFWFESLVTDWQQIDQKLYTIRTTLCA